MQFLDKINEHAGSRYCKTPPAGGESSSDANLNVILLGEVVPSSSARGVKRGAAKPGCREAVPQASASNGACSSAAWNIWPDPLLVEAVEERGDDYAAAKALGKRRRADQLRTDCIERMRKSDDLKLDNAAKRRRCLEKNKKKTIAERKNSWAELSSASELCRPDSAEHFWDNLNCNSTGRSSSPFLDTATSEAALFADDADNEGICNDSSERGDQSDPLLVGVRALSAHGEANLLASSRRPATSARDRLEAMQRRAKARLAATEDVPSFVSSA